MMIRQLRFNIYLLGVLPSLLFCGCAHEPVKNIDTSLRLHPEMRPDASERTTTIAIFRAHPLAMTIDKNPFIIENMVKQVKVVDALGGFALQIQFDKKGTWLLEQYSSSLRGKHIAIFSQFIEPGDKKMATGRWLAAPLISQRITDGLLVFTPDATREEAEKIASGLNAVAKKMHIDEPFESW